jgi:hypothetical protein
MEIRSPGFAVLVAVIIVGALELISVIVAEVYEPDVSTGPLRAMITPFDDFALM